MCEGQTDRPTNIIIPWIAQLAAGAIKKLKFCEQEFEIWFLNLGMKIKNKTKETIGKRDWSVNFQEYTCT